MNFLAGICIALAVSSCNAVIRWQPGDWAYGCVFLGDDLSTIIVASDQCGSACARTRGCTHFTWTTYNGGTCWMKRNPASKADAIQSNDQSLICGLNSGSSSGSGGSGSSGIQWQGNWAFACDFVGGNLTSAQLPGKKCGDLCATSNGCTHFTWSNYNGGTCWLKRGAVTRSDAYLTNDYTMICGINCNRDCEDGNAAASISPLFTFTFASVLFTLYLVAFK